MRERCWKVGAAKLKGSKGGVATAYHIKILVTSIKSKIKARETPHPLVPDYVSGREVAKATPPY